MRHRADQLSKSLLRDALSCASASLPDTEVEVLAATQKIDVYAVPNPARTAERARMGLLGELSAEPSLFEPFRCTPNLARARRLLCKQLTWHHESSVVPAQRPAQRPTHQRTIPMTTMTRRRRSSPSPGSS